MGKPLEEHCADFIMMHRAEEYRRYRKECLKFWREYYGERFADQVEKMVKEKWAKK